MRLRLSRHSETKDTPKSGQGPRVSGVLSVFLRFLFVFVGRSTGSLGYAIMLPGRKSAFRAGFWPSCYRESTAIGPPAGRRPAGGPISRLSR